MPEQCQGCEILNTETIIRVGGHDFAQGMASHT